MYPIFWLDDSAMKLFLAFRRLTIGKGGTTMLKKFWGGYGKQTVTSMAFDQLRKRGMNPRYGFALFRDKRVPISTKFFSSVLGVGLMLIVQALGLFPQAWLELLIPGIGFAAGRILDGLEFILLPILFSSLSIQVLVPNALKYKILEERMGGTQEPLPVVMVDQNTQQQK